MFGLAYTLAFATLTVGHLNILTITFRADAHRAGD